MNHKLIQLRLVLFFILLIFSLRVFAHQSSEDSWGGFFLKKDLAPSYSLWTEMQLRYDISDSTMEQTLLRFGLLKKISAQHELGVLLAFVQTDSRKEHRFALQHVQKYGSLIGAKLSHRARLEFRNFENIGGGSGRFRYLLRAENQSFKSFKPVFWNELFLNLERGPFTGNRHFERNRIFLGIRKVFKDDLALEFGYLNQYVPRSGEDSMEHILFVGMFFK